MSDTLVASRPRPRRVRLVVGATLQVGLTLGLLGLVVTQWGLSPFTSAARALPWWAVVAGLGLGAAGVVLQALRWRLVARHLQISLPVGPAVARCWQAAFLNSVLPGGVAGDALRAADDSSDAEAPDGRRALASGFAAVAAERLVGTTVVLVAAAVALLGSVPLVGVACLAGGVVTAAVAWRWLRVLPLRDLALVLLLSVAGWAAFVGMFVLAVVVVAPDVEVSLAPGLATVSVAAMSVPVTVGGWGTREAAAGWIFMVRGLDMGTGVTVSIGYGILALLSTLPGAAILAVRVAPRWREAGRARHRRRVG
ncbi:lysylphosphatidylglycerol synthase domain-containing protein [uncultured Serinicoccus sp.]|uniref:lysylphosphatidylglycerol synthase domain-containing protein n=1 Tax=uncultured Serinicoccus sp. TaxID=735514 RepID=UPI0026340A2B|nr:lysylphosphatidylglycerol synthase domain-containing protein [uncultured Serinicoccus sp.]